jgi:aryl-alcohol dehydrogenase-like predicted oxidoreductase
MEYVHLGRLGLKVSPLCLVTMNFGWDLPGTEEQEAFASWTGRSSRHQLPRHGERLRLA